MQSSPLTTNFVLSPHFPFFFLIILITSSNSACLPVLVSIHRPVASTDSCSAQFTKCFGYIFIINSASMCAFLLIISSTIRLLCCPSFSGITMPVAFLKSNLMYVARTFPLFRSFGVVRSWSHFSCSLRLELLNFVNILESLELPGKQ